MIDGISVLTNHTLHEASFEEYVENPHVEPLDIYLNNNGQPVTVDVFLKDSDAAPVRFYNTKITVTEAESVTLSLMYNNGSVSSIRKVITKEIIITGTS